MWSQQEKQNKHHNKKQRQKKTNICWFLVLNCCYWTNTNSKRFRICIFFIYQSLVVWLSTHCLVYDCDNAFYWYCVNCLAMKFVYLPCGGKTHLSFVVHRFYMVIFYYYYLWNSCVLFVDLNRMTFFFIIGKIQIGTIHMSHEERKKRMWTSKMFSLDGIILYIDRQKNTHLPIEFEIKSTNIFL